MKYKKRDTRNITEWQEYIGCLVKTKRRDDNRCANYSLLAEVYNDKHDKGYDILSLLSYKEGKWDREVFLRKDIEKFFRVII